MSCEFGRHVRLTLFGQSHGEAIGAVMDGLPAGEPIDLEQVQSFLRRRAPGQAHATARVESDIPHVLSGLTDGCTCGAPLCAVIENHGANSRDYDALRDTPRPMHADYPANVKLHGHADLRGGGLYSARLTAALCFAGAVCMQLLARRGIRLGAHLLRVQEETDTPFDPLMTDSAVFDTLSARSPAVLDMQAGARMLAAIDAAREAGDSVGGVIECAVFGVPAGLGDPMFGGMENRIAAAVFGIPAVKGVEFGAGAAVSHLRGSAHNDAFYYDEAGHVRTRTNRHGGVLGGMTTGMPLLLTCHIKPTPSIALPQESVNLQTHESVRLCVPGRHDPCTALRAVPCVEAAAAVALLDLYQEGLIDGIG